MNAETERLATETFERRSQRLPGRELATELALAGLLLVAMLALAALATPARSFDAPLALGFLVAYVALHRLEVHMGDGSFVPTQLLLVPMLLLLPAPLVPLLITIATVCACVIEVARGRRAPIRLL